MEIPFADLRPMHDEIRADLDALYLVLKAYGIGAGDEVIVPSNTFIATALAVSYAGATPVFVEPVLETFNIDASRIEAAITPKSSSETPPITGNGIIWIAAASLPTQESRIAKIAAPPITQVL